MKSLVIPEGEDGKICQIAVVVKDLEEAVERYWKTLGFGPWYFWDFEPPDLHDVYYRGMKVESSGFRLALAQVGPIQYEIMQPLYGIGIHREFLEKHGEGRSSHEDLFQERNEYGA